MDVAAYAVEAEAPFGGLWAVVVSSRERSIRSSCLVQVEFSMSGPRPVAILVGRCRSTMLILYFMGARLSPSDLTFVSEIVKRRLPHGA